MKGICNKCAKKDGCDKYKELSKTDYNVVSCIDFIKDFETVATYYNAEVLDKIRAEIEKERVEIHTIAFKGEYNNLFDDGRHNGLLKALEIIDKYRKGARNENIHNR